MKGFQIISISNSADCFLIEADSFSMEMYSINRFFQSVVLILFLVFMRMVLLAMVKTTESILVVDVLFRFMLDMSPSRQSHVPCGMHVVVYGILCAVWTHFRIYETHFKQLFPCVVYSMNSFVLN